mmetsp:Transcript_15866/g.42689  ORF Transcript_15866/g.42689 Transcript_15866/m.42689 type:complete len:319 (+) Transcript_15866:670-1626(+)
MPAKGATPRPVPLSLDCSKRTLTFGSSARKLRCHSGSCSPLLLAAPSSPTAEPAPAPDSSQCRSEVAGRPSTSPVPGGGSAASSMAMSLSDRFQKASPSTRDLAPAHACWSSPASISARAERLPTPHARAEMAARTSDVAGRPRLQVGMLRGSTSTRRSMAARASSSSAPCRRRGRCAVLSPCPPTPRAPARGDARPPSPDALPGMAAKPDAPEAPPRSEAMPLPMAAAAPEPTAMAAAETVPVGAPLAGRPAFAPPPTGPMCAPLPLLVGGTRASLAFQRWCRCCALCGSLVAPGPPCPCGVPSEWIARGWCACCCC